MQNSRVKQRLLNPPANPWIEALSNLRHYFRFLVELRPVRTKLRTRGTSISFPPRPLLASCFRHVCHVIEQESYPHMPLFIQFSCFAEVDFPWHFFLAESVFTFIRY